MNEDKKQKKNFCILWCFIICSVVFCVIYFVGGIHYAVNDDIAMREIASGVRSGTPDGHLVYIKYPLGWFICMLYSVVSRSIDWYGLVLLGSLFLAAMLLTYSVHCAVKDKGMEIVFHLIK